MCITSVPRIARWPFFAGDGFLLALASYLCFHGKSTPEGWGMFACVACVVFGAILATIPFLFEYWAALKLAETESLVTVGAQLKNLEQLAAQIGYANSQWNLVREAADKTAYAAKGIAQGIAAEASSFKEFIQSTNEGERAALKLEVEKLRRAEGEWLQVLVRMLDHVYALYQAAARSEQKKVAEQLGKFQTACHEAARRIGLVPFVAAPDALFDGERHQLIEDDAKAPEGAQVEETIANGYTFQGKLIRPALVKVRGELVRDRLVAQTEENLLVPKMADPSTS